MGRMISVRSRGISFLPESARMATFLSARSDSLGVENTIAFFCPLSLNTAGDALPPALPGSHLQPGCAQQLCHPRKGHPVCAQVPG
eukprot:1160827-Pelagomonas_calceolata.AAC.4